MKEQSSEQLYASLQRGMSATQDLAVVLPLIAERRENLIIAACARFESREHPLTPVDALLFVAALVENQRLKNELEHVERAGRRAGQKLS